MRGIKPPERKFVVQFIVGERALGRTLADLDGVEGLQSSLIEHRDPTKNLPRGAITGRLLDMLKAGPVKRSVLREKLKEAGLPVHGFSSTLDRLQRQGDIKVTGKGSANATVSLTNNKKE